MTFESGTAAGRSRDLAVLGFAQFRAGGSATLTLGYTHFVC
jgi:hypothetical protein